jgi:hypothetical protein
MIHVAILALLAFTAARAELIYNISMNTGPLIGHPAGPFSLGLELADGSGTGDGNNAVFLSDFAFGAGGPSGSPVIFGSAGWDLSSSVVLTDATPFSTFVQSFASGSTLSFVLDITTNVDSGGTPDEFIMSILDNTFTPIPTTASSSPLNPFLVIDIDSSNPTVQTFSSDATQFPAGGGGPISIGPPTVSTVPEPSTTVPSALLSLYLIGAKFRSARNGLRVRSATRGDR